MAKKIKKKVTPVRSHPLHVRVSAKNPSGMTTRHRHFRRLKGTYLDREEIENIFKSYDKKKITYPAKNKGLGPNADAYDDIIAVWTDYFNKKFNSVPPLDPDLMKALIFSESDFRENPYNPKAFGIAQITPETFKILLDSKGEVKEFIFRDIRKKDLIDPKINIPMAVRWIFRKKRFADGRLGGAATHEEIILEYKGLLKSKTEYKGKALNKYRGAYEKLKSK